MLWLTGKPNFIERRTSKYVAKGTNSIAYCIVQCLMIQESGCLASYDPTVFSAGWEKTMLVFLDPRNPGKH